MTTSIRAAEARLFWELSSEIRHRARLGAKPARLQAQRDELEVMAAHTDWPRLQKRCHSTIVLVMPEGSQQCEFLA